MKITLVVPNSEDLREIHPSRTLRKASLQLPLGLLYVAAAAEQAGHEVVILDNYLEALPEPELLRRIMAGRPDCVGFSTTILNIWQGFSLARSIKAERPGVWTVFGGPQPSLDPQATLQRAGVDCLIRGEGERAFVRLLEALPLGAEAMAAVPGVICKDSDGQMLEGPPPEPIADLSGLVRPARHLIDVNRYGRLGAGLLRVPVDVLATSRGCSFRCAFCSSAEYWKRKYRTRPPVEVVDEMEFMLKEYGSRGFYFREDNFTLNKKHVLGICDEIMRRGLEVVWECESRVDTLNREVMARMVEAGCRFIWCGVESGSQRILDILCKGITVEKTRRFYADAHSLGIRTGAGFMIGVPGETEEDIQLSVQLAREIEADYVGFLSYVAFPGSPLYKQVCQEGWYSLEWESIRFVETDSLSRQRVLELELELERKFRWRKIIRRPLQTFSAAVKARWNRRKYARARECLR